MAKSYRKCLFSCKSELGKISKWHLELQSQDLLLKPKQRLVSTIVLMRGNLDLKLNSSGKDNATFMTVQ